MRAHLKPDLIICEVIEKSHLSPATCAEFGCAKKLSLIEQLAGNKCTEHMEKKKVDIMKVLKFR